MKSIIKLALVVVAASSAVSGATTPDQGAQNLPIQDLITPRNNIQTRMLVEAYQRGLQRGLESKKGGPALSEQLVGQALQGLMIGNQLLDDAVKEAFRRGFQRGKL